MSDEYDSVEEVEEVVEESEEEEDEPKKKRRKKKWKVSYSLSCQPPFLNGTFSLTLILVSTSGPQQAKASNVGILPLLSSRSASSEG